MYSRELTKQSSKKIMFSFIFIFFAASATILRQTSAESDASTNFWNGRFVRQVTEGCSRTEFTCKNQNCVALSDLCNGIDDCEDGSDETSEHCKIIHTGSCGSPDETENCNQQIPPPRIQLLDASEDTSVENESHSFLCRWLPVPRHGENVPLRCVNGVWTPETSFCTRVCRRVSISAVSIECFRNGKKQPCKAPLLSGTKIRTYCAPNYEPNYRTTTCLANGEWDHDQIECSPICGKPYKTNTRCIEALRPADYREFPWSAALYNTDKRGVLCPVTLITPYLFISAASCVFHALSGYKLTGKKFEIIVAKRTQCRRIEDDDEQRGYKIREIYFTEEEYEGSAKHFDKNIALIEVTERVRFGAAVYPICLNWKKSEDLKPDDGTLGQVTSWKAIKPDGSQTYPDILQTAAMKYRSHDYCLNNSSNELSEWLTEDKYCVDPIVPPTPVIPGSAWNFHHKETNKFFLLGILSNVLFTEYENTTTFTNISYHMDWINKIRRQNEKRLFLKDEEIDTKPGSSDTICPSSSLHSLNSSTAFSSQRSQFTDDMYSSEGCTLPARETLNADYMVNCPSSQPETVCKRARENGIVPEFTTLQLSCHKEYSMESDSEIVCLKSKWRPAPLPCKRICKPLKIENMRIKCYNGDYSAECGGEMKAGIRVVPECIDEYRPEYTSDFKEIVCQDDGEWSNPLYRCVPKCGVPAFKANLSAPSRSGRYAELGEFPWHVGIYDITKESKPLICGGTIISPYVIISAAHCHADENGEMKRAPYEFEVAVGKISREYSAKDSESTKYYEIEYILENNFHGKRMRYKSDIALLITRNKIEFNPYVLPICMQYVSRIMVPSGTELQVPGWGVDKQSQPTSTLKVSTLPFLGDSECVRRAPPSLIDYLTEDKFCSGDVNGTAVETGDSGGGLLYKDRITSLYYLYGVVSVKSADASSIALFTNVYYHKEWIIKNRDKIHLKKKEF